MNLLPSEMIPQWPRRINPVIAVFPSPRFRNSLRVPFSIRHRANSFPCGRDRLRALSSYRPMFINPRNRHPGRYRSSSKSRSPFVALDTDRFQKSTRRLRKLLKKGSKLLGPEDVHDLRTNARKVESAINAVQLASKNNERRLLRALSRIRKKAGKVRDMDVLTSDLAGVSLEHHRDCQTQLIEYLGVERERRAKQLRHAIERRGATARKRLKRTEKRFDKIAGKKASSGETGKTSAAATALDLSADLASPATLNRGNLHPYRLKVKELRYVLQIAEDGANRRFIEALGASKDAIGDWHDWEELIAIAEEVLDKKPGCPVLAELRRISREKYDLAVSATTKMRNEYLEQAHPGKSRSSVYKHEPSQQALKAVAAIAS
jgi:CHAD domain-containing protein